MRPRGFTLIELLVAISIIGILVMIALPQYSQYVARSRQQDARTQLMAVLQAEEAYKLQYGSYTSTTSVLSGWKATQGKYSFSVTSATATAFTAQATGNIDSDATNDVWTIDQDGTLSNTTNDVDS